LLASFETIIPVKYHRICKAAPWPRNFRVAPKARLGELKMLLAAAAGDAIRTGIERITEDIIDRCNYMPPSARKQRSASG
jgi:hypothetical protein